MIQLDNTADRDLRISSQDHIVYTRPNNTRDPDSSMIYVALMKCYYITFWIDYQPNVDALYINSLQTTLTTRRLETASDM